MSRVAARIRQISGRVLHIGFALITTATLASCVEPMDTTRPVSPNLTTGEKIYVELCNRVAMSEDPLDVSGAKTLGVCKNGDAPAADAGPRLHAIHNLRAELVLALDNAVARGVSNDLNDYLVSILPLYDDNILQNQTHALAQIIENIQTQPEALDALQRLDARTGYREATHALGLLKPVLSYPRFSALSGQMSLVVAPGGIGSSPWRQVLEAIQREADNAASTFNYTPESNYYLARDLLLSTNADFAESNQATWVAARDNRGMALPALVNGHLIAPFVDRDGDGMADVNATGQFIDANGALLNVPTPFHTPDESTTIRRDSGGRALNANGELLYQYIDASQTFFAATIAEGSRLLTTRPSALWDLTGPVRLLMGPTLARQYKYPNGIEQKFQGYDTQRSPLADAVYAGSLVADKAFVRRSMSLVTTLLDDHESEVADVAATLMDLRQWLDQEPFKSAELKENSNLVDDLVEWSIQVAMQDGLLNDVLDAMQAPASRPLGALFAKQMRYIDRFDYNPQDLNGAPIGGYFTPVTRARADLSNNQSIMQRFLHLVHDTNGAKFCNKEGAKMVLAGITYPNPILHPNGFRKCELFQIDNMAEFYIQAVLGKAELVFKDPLVNLMSNIDFMLETTSGIDGFTKHPTPQALNRMIFAPRNEFLQNLVDAPLSADGVELEQRHQGTIFAWEKDNFYEAIRPLMRAFADHGREDLLANLMSIMHKHYATSASQTTQSTNPLLPAYSYQSGLVQFEELVARVVGDDDFLNVQADLLDALDVTIADGYKGREIVIDAALTFLKPGDNAHPIKLRDGRTGMKKSDGVTDITTLSPAWVMLDAFNKIDARLAPYPTEKAAFKEGVKAIIDQVLPVELTRDGPRFSNRRAIAMVHQIMPFILDRLNDHVAKNDLAAWAASMNQRFDDTIRQPLVASGLQVLDSVYNHSGARSEMDAFNLYLLDVYSANDTRAHLLTAGVDGLQAMADSASLIPLLTSTTSALDPDTGLLASATQFAKASYIVDTQNVMGRLLANLVEPMSAQTTETVLESLVSSMTTINRAAPGTTGWLDSNDFGTIMATVRSFLNDDERGVERLYDLVANRL